MYTLYSRDDVGYKIYENGRHENWCVCVCGIKLMVYAVNGKCHFEWCQTWLRGTQRINGIHLNRSILRRTGGVESEMGMVGDGMKLKNLTASSCHHTNLWVMQMMLM